MSQRLSIRECALGGWLPHHSRLSAPEKGYIGILPQKYKGSALCRAPSGPLYNTNPVPRRGAFTVAGGTGNCGAGAYRAQGRTYAFTGSGYNTYSTYTSPNQNFPG